MPEGPITVDELPEPIRAKVKATIGPARVVEVGFSDSSLLSGGGDTYTVNDLVGGWLVPIGERDPQPDRRTGPAAGSHAGHLRGRAVHEFEQGSQVHSRTE